MSSWQAAKLQQEERLAAAAAAATTAAIIWRKQSDISLTAMLQGEVTGTITPNLQPMARDTNVQEHQKRNRENFFFRRFNPWRDS